MSIDLTPRISVGLCDCHNNYPTLKSLYAAIYLKLQQPRNTPRARDNREYLEAL